MNIDNTTKIQLGKSAYKWIEPWTHLPDSEAGWAHHGLCMNAKGQILSGHASTPTLFTLEKNGSISDSQTLPVSEIHHIHTFQQDDNEFILVCDLGDKDADDSYQTEARLIQFNGQGSIQQTWNKDSLCYKEEQAFKPTSSFADIKNKTLWIADGYGSSLVHCTDLKGNLLFTLDGTEGGGRFDCPHTVFVDDRFDDPKIYIADRSNHRIQQYTSDGTFIGLLDIEQLNTPSAFAVLGDELLVVELEARIHLLDKQNCLIGTYFDGRHHVNKPGWPNRVVDGKLHAPDDVEQGILNSPHSICVDESKNIYISEWLFGDRFIKLEKIT